ncbi:hypothetical protein DPV78_012827 [Talaromyces pinophilus]|nr:hypothetical protein DPV78_012827 [Talaromyces pinophilus]
MRSNAPSTVSTYRACAEKNGFVEDIIPLESGANGLWLSTPWPLTDAKKILIYFHGGWMFLVPVINKTGV